MINILIIEDDPLWRHNLTEMMRPFGKVKSSGSLEGALSLIEKNEFDIAFFDLDLGGTLKGLQLVDKAKKLGLYNVIISAHDSDKVISDGYTRGCMDYLIKPISDKALELIFKKYYSLSQSENIGNIIAQRFITKDPQTLDTLEIVKKVNLSSKSILLTGESGTGKTCLAKIIHDITTEESAPFISLNCSQFNESTIDSEIFGHKKGSFTGATSDKKGLIEVSQGGTLFLDEVHSLSARAQQKLLTSLETGMIYPVGASKPIHVNFRIICATCEQIEDLVAAGSFRRDLYYRIKTFVFHLKPLRQRPDDILPLVSFYLNKRERRMVLTQEAKKILQGYHWPANAREIDDLVENWAIRGVGIITKDDFPACILNPVSNNKDESFFTDNQLAKLQNLGLKAFLEEVKANALNHFLLSFDGKQVNVAKALGVSKSMVSKFLDKGKEAPFEQRRIH